MIRDIKFIDMLISNDDNSIILKDSKGKKYKYDFSNDNFNLLNNKRMNDMKNIIANVIHPNIELVIFKNIENRARLLLKRGQLSYGTSDIFLYSSDEEEYIKSIINDYIGDDSIININKVYKINDKNSYQQLILIENNKRIRIIGLDLGMLLDANCINKKIVKRGI